MRQDAAEPLLADVTLANILMPVHSRSKRCFRIVGMDQFHILHHEDAVRVAYCLVQSSFAANIEAGCEQMASVQAATDRQIRQARGEVENRAQLFEPGPDVASAPRGAFDEQPEVPQRQTLRRLGEPM